MGMRAGPRIKDLELETLSNRLSINPRDVEARKGLASLFERRRDYRAANQHYGVLMLIDPANREQYSAAGRRCQDFEERDRVEFERFGGL